MADQTMFLPPELIARILPHVELREQVIFRRINNQFKNVIERAVWPSCKRVDVSSDIIPKEKRKSILRHMIFLEDVIFDEDEYNYEDDEEYDNYMENNTLGILIEFCHQVNKMKYRSKSVVYPGVIKNHSLFNYVTYAQVLSEKYIYSIGNKKLIFEMNDVKDFKSLDRLPMEVNYCISYEGIAIPKRYQPKVTKQIRKSDDSDKNLPYCFNVEELSLHDKQDNIDSFYFKQVKKLELYKMERNEMIKFTRFTNLTSLKIDSRFEEEEDELVAFNTLIDYLKSHDSRNLSSLSYNFEHDDMFDKFLLRFSFMDRPVKWNYLKLKVESMDVILFKGRQLEYDVCWPYEPMQFLESLISKMNSPRTFLFQPDEYHDLGEMARPEMSKVQFDSWKRFIESYSSSRRDVNIRLFLWSKEDDSLNYHVSGDNYTITYSKDLIVD